MAVGVPACFTMVARISSSFVSSGSKGFLVLPRPWLSRAGPIPYEIRLREIGSGTKMQPIPCVWRFYAKDPLVDRNFLSCGMLGECGACATNRQNRSRSGGIGRGSRDLGNQRGNRPGTEAGADRQVRGGCGQRRGLPDSGEWLVRGLLPRAEKLRPSVRIWRQTFCARPGQFPERDEYGSRGFGKG